MSSFQTLDRRTCVKIVVLFLGYLAVSPALSLTFKWLESEADFAYPTLIMCPVLTLETLLLFLFDHCSRDGKAAPTTADGTRFGKPRLIVAIGLLFAIEVGLSNLSLISLPLVYHTILKVAPGARAHAARHAPRS